MFGGREEALEDVAELALRRLPLVVGNLPIQSSWWGYYEVSPDHNAIVGRRRARGARVRDRLLRARLPARPVVGGTSPS